MENRKFTMGLALGFLVLSYAIVFLPGGQVINLTQEDSLIEWVGALLFLGASIIFLLVFFRSKDPSKTLAAKWSWSVLLLALFFFVSFGEEISWMQRIIGYRTPGPLLEYNLQEELNLHNLKWIHGKNDDGSAKIGLAALFTAKRLFICFCLFLFVIVPLLSKIKRPFGDLFHRVRTPIFPISIGGIFLLNLFLAKFVLPAWFDHAPDLKHALVEIMEANFGSIAFVEALWLFTSSSLQSSAIYTHRP